MSELVTVDHPQFKFALSAIFTQKVVADCMTHSCTMVASHTKKLDACCQYGADVDLHERDNILARADELRAILTPAAAAARWFDPELEADDDMPSGHVTRTETHGDGCVFLSHDGRGCAIHRASIENGWDFHGTKPHVCRLFPLSYTSDTIVISDDYLDYSCAYDASAPSLYRVARDTLSAVFGPALVIALDRAEAHVLGIALAAGTPRVHLPLASS
jgi:Fe-S-cluster containining protein